MKYGATLAVAALLAVAHADDLYAEKVAF